MPQPSSSAQRRLAVSRDAWSRMTSSKEASNAFSASLSKRLSSMRLQQYRNELNAGLRQPPTPASPSLHAALDFVERESRKTQAATQKAHVAGPVPAGWIPVPSVSLNTQKGRQERRKLRPRAVGDEAACDDDRLSVACLRNIARLLSAGDEEMLAVVNMLPMHLIESLMRVAAMDAPLNAVSLSAMLLRPALSEGDDQEAESEERGEEWEARANAEVDPEHLTQLDLRFALLNNSELLNLLLIDKERPRFSALTLLDLSYCSGLNLNSSLIWHLRHLRQLTHLALNGHEYALQSQPGALTRLASSTPWLQVFEVDGSVSLGLLDRFAWGSLWQRLEKVVVRGFRLPAEARVGILGASGQPRSGHLKPPARETARDDEKAAEQAEAAIRTAVKKAGRIRWLDIVV